MIKSIMQLPRIVVIDRDGAYPLIREGLSRMQTIHLDGKMYQAQVNDKGDIVEIQRYNEKYGIYVTLKFAQEENPKVKSELLTLLKSSYIQQMTGVLKTT
jgi:hypothetical protein